MVIPQQNKMANLYAGKTAPAKTPPGFYEASSL